METDVQLLKKKRRRTNAYVAFGVNINTFNTIDTNLHHRPLGRHRNRRTRRQSRPFQPVATIIALRKAIFPRGCFSAPCTHSAFGAFDWAGKIACRESRWPLCKKKRTNETIWWIRKVKNSKRFFVFFVIFTWIVQSFRNSVQRILTNLLCFLPHRVRFAFVSRSDFKSSFLFDCIQLNNGKMLISCLCEPSQVRKLTWDLELFKFPISIQIRRKFFTVETSP